MWLPPSLLPLAIPALPAFQFLDGADSLCRTERVPPWQRRRLPATGAPSPDPSCGCHAGNLGVVISLALHSAECHVMSRGGSIISSGFQVCNRDWACFFLQLCACPNRVNSLRCTFFARSDDEDLANKQRQFPHRLCCYVAVCSSLRARKTMT